MTYAVKNIRTKKIVRGGFQTAEEARVWRDEHYSTKTHVVVNEEAVQRTKTLPDGTKLNVTFHGERK